MKPDSVCWLSPSVEVKPSSIGGTGLFATECIQQGALVSRLGGVLVSTVELHRRFDASVDYVDTISVGPDAHLVLPGDSPNHHGNHSCDPNLWWDGPYDLIARRDIERGEEVTSDYSASTIDPAFSMECRCGEVSCRRTIRGSDAWTYRLDEVYEGHVVPIAAHWVASRESA